MTDREILLGIVWTTMLFHDWLTRSLAIAALAAVLIVALIEE